MNFQSFRKNPGFLVWIAMFWVLVSSSAFAQEWPSVSGFVVNEFRDPIAGISVELQLYDVFAGGIVERGGAGGWQKQTDAEGRFSIMNIIPAKAVRFAVKGEKKGDKTEEQILSIETGKLTLYPRDAMYFDVIRFSLDGGTKIENSIITVKTDIRPQARVRVVFADGRPVTNAQIHTRMLRWSLGRSGYGSADSTEQTDAEGYFVKDLMMDNQPQFYVLGIAYEGLFAKTPAFILHKGQSQTHLLLTLNDNPIPPDERSPEQMTTALAAFLDPPTMWVVNPTNGHAYKRIYCYDIADAMDQAAAENAYLVSINDPAENEWVRETFGRENFWIGLSDAEKEGQWQWHSGEPITYTNWLDNPELAGKNTEVKDYIISAAGRWQIVAEGDINVIEAIIERADMPVITPSERN
ncbi:MAG: lectin-like protein [Candidatus Poribacteria bacterium]|nr:lectin-like protein [Candidatus Poribacteria bacterium]